MTTQPPPPAPAPGKQDCKTCANAALAFDLMPCITCDRDFDKWTPIATPAPDQDAREAVARAICVACDERPDHAGDCQGNAKRWQDYLGVADAALAAAAPAPTTGGFQNGNTHPAPAVVSQQMPTEPGWDMVAELTDEQIKVLIPDGDGWKFDVGFSDATAFARAVISADRTIRTPGMGHRKPLDRHQIGLVATYAPEGVSNDEVAEIVAKVELMHGIVRVPQVTGMQGDKP